MRTPTSPGSCVRSATRWITVAARPAGPIVSSGRTRSAATPPYRSCTTTSRRSSRYASRCPRPRRTSAAKSVRSFSSSASSALSARGVGATSRSGAPPSLRLGSRTCGSHFTQSQSPIRSASAATANAASSGAWNAASCASSARITASTSSREPMTLTLPAMSRGTVSGMSGAVPNRRTAPRASASMNGSLGASAVPRSRSFSSAPGIVPVPMRTRRKSGSRRRRSHSRAGSRTTSYSASGGGSSSRARVRASRSARPSSSRSSSRYSRYRSRWLRRCRVTCPRRESSSAAPTSTAATSITAPSAMNAGLRRTVITVSDPIIPTIGRIANT